MSEKKEKATEKEKTLFEKLRAIDVSKHIEKKNGLSYLSWAWAWDVFKQHCPDATYTIRDFDGFLCTGNQELGYMVHTTVTAGDESHSMWLPVMDFKNKAIKSPDTFDINKTVMRCLVKNLAMFGLGLHIYAGEDLPESEDAPKQASKTTSKQTPKETAKPASKEPIPDEEHEALRKAIADAPDMDTLKNAFITAQLRAQECRDRPALEGYIKVKDIRKAELEQQAKPQEA